jgi:hypothetical protein
MCNVIITGNAELSWNINLTFFTVFMDDMCKVHSRSLCYRSKTCVPYWTWLLVMQKASSE